MQTEEVLFTVLCVHLMLLFARFVLSNQCLDLHRSDGQIRKHNTTEYDADMNRQMDTGHENDNVNHRRYDAKNSYKTNDDDFSVNQNTHGDS